MQDRIMLGYFFSKILSALNQFLWNSRNITLAFLFLLCSQFVEDFLTGQLNKETLDRLPFQFTTAIQALVNRTLQSNNTPSVWKRQLKDSTSDYRIPINYKGINLLSVVSEVYSNGLKHTSTTTLQQTNKTNLEKVEVAKTLFYTGQF